MLDAVTTAYFVLSILGGQVLLPLVLGTCLISKRVHRHPLLLEFLACWTVYSLATCILCAASAAVRSSVSHGGIADCTRDTKRMQRSRILCVSRKQLL